MKKYIMEIVVLLFIEISGSLYLTFWRENFWNAVANKESLHFLQQLGVFTVIALVLCFVAGIAGYIVSLATIEWREALNAKAHTITHNHVENLNQRIQDDCWAYPDLFLNIVVGLLKASVYISVFSVSLLFSFSGWFLGILLSYSLIGTWLAKKIATPLIQLNYEQQRAEATYRNGLTIPNFAECVRIMLGLAKKQKHLTYFQQFYGQLGVVLPLIIIAPVYFTTEMTLGSLMRFNSLSSTILDNMSFGINSFSSINKLLSCRRRLKEAQIL